MNSATTRMAPALCLLLTTSGCATTSLKGKAVDRIVLSLANEGPVCPGEVRGLIVAATIGKETFTTSGDGKGSLSWNNFAIDVTAGTVINPGQVSFAHDQAQPLAREVKIVARAVDHRDQSSRKTVTLDFACPVRVDFSGARGSQGEPGKTGAEGGSGAARDGLDGRDGGTGGAGHHAGNLEVRVRLVQTDRGPLIQASIFRQTEPQPHVAVFDPRGGTLTIRANGGAGGDGGTGGQGGAGSMAVGDWAPGDGGDGGDGGNGGIGGDGGDIEMIVAPEAAPFVDRIMLENHGGAGGSGGTRGRGGTRGLSGIEAHRSSSYQDRESHNGFLGGRGRAGQPGADGPPPKISVAAVEPDHPGPGGEIRGVDAP